MKKAIILISVITLMSLSGFAQYKQHNNSQKQYDHVWAQSKHLTKLGVNGVYFGGKGLLGHTVSADYSYNVANGWDVSARVMTGWASSVKDFPAKSDITTLFASAVTARVTPWEEDLGWINFEFGFLYQNIANASQREGSGGVAVPSFVNRNLYGLIYSFSIRFYSNDTIVVGLRGDILTSVLRGYNFDAYQMGVFLGYRF